MTIYLLQGRPPYCTNCYLVLDEEGNAVLIDAEATPAQVRTQLEKHGASLRAICLTHGHFDHVGNLQPLKAEFDAEVWMSAQDQAFFNLQADKLYTEEPVKIGQIVLQPVFTPGHTPGSTCLIGDTVLFSGDTLFAGSVGRTDLKGGNAALLWKSLKYLCSVITQDLQVLPGHEDFSTMEEEKRSNPYLRRAMTMPE